MLFNVRRLNKEITQQLCVDNAVIRAHRSELRRHYITHNPPARTGGVHGVDQPMPASRSQDLGGTGVWQNNVVPLGQVSECFSNGLNDCVEIVVFFFFLNQTAHRKVMLTTVVLLSLTRLSIYDILNIIF